jgi:hypothetical protein
MAHRLLRSAALGLSATAVTVAAGMAPAHAAATEGHKTFEFSHCVTDDGVGFTFCAEGVNRGIEVHQPNGRSVFVSSGTATFTYAYTNGEVHTVESTYRGVSNFSYWLDGLYYDPQMILAEGTTSFTQPDGTQCTVDSGFLGVDRREVRSYFDMVCTPAG